MSVMTVNCFLLALGLYRIAGVRGDVARLDRPVEDFAQDLTSLTNGLTTERSSFPTPCFRN